MEESGIRFGDQCRIGTIKQKSLRKRFGAGLFAGDSTRRARPLSSARVYDRTEFPKLFANFSEKALLNQ
jgi:hypothetical protein